MNLPLNSNKNKQQDEPLVDGESTLPSPVVCKQKSSDDTEVWTAGDIAEQFDHHDNQNSVVPSGVDQEHFQKESIPEFIGSYPIERKLNSGAEGTVFLGHHPRLEKKIAIKVISLDINKTRKEALNECSQEARITDRFNHPNIIRLYDFGEDAVVGSYIVMEYAERGDLATLLEKKKKLDIKFATSVVKGVANALMEAKKHHVVHRDVKPQNIMLSKDGTVKLADLGLAKFTNSALDLTKTGSSFGTPYYMAPEQFDDAKHVDHRADIYALGVTFYQLVTGKLPFTGDTKTQIMRKKDLGKFIKPKSLESSLDKGINDIICRMIARMPEERYPSPEELLHDLKFLRRGTKGKSLTIRAITVLSIMVLALLIVLLSRPLNKTDAYPVLERYFAAGKNHQALSFLQKLGDITLEDNNLLYAQGLSYLQQNRIDNVRKIINKLDQSQAGIEKARHLEILIHLNEQRVDKALEMIDQWLPQVSHKLPFLDSRGIALSKQGKTVEAKQAFEGALQEDSAFDFQRLALVDHFAKLLANEGNFAAARALYSKALKENSSALSNSTLLTNYAQTMMKSGKFDEALGIVQRAARSNPHDEMVLYMQKILADKINGATDDNIRETIDMINDINQSIINQENHNDKWTSTAKILTFLPLENRDPTLGRLGIESLWADELTNMIRRQNNFPIVKRGSLNYLLRELKLNVSALGASSVPLKIGSLLPASVLVNGAFIEDGKRMGLTLRLVDVETSELIALIDEIVEDGDRKKLFSSLSYKLTETLQDNYPIKGKVLAGDGKIYEINIGKYHGLKQGQALRLYLPMKSPSVRLLSRKEPVAQATVSELDNFRSLIHIEKTSEPIVPEMLVLANALR